MIMKDPYVNSLVSFIVLVGMTAVMYYSLIFAVCGSI